MPSLGNLSLTLLSFILFLVAAPSPASSVTGPEIAAYFRRSLSPSAGIYLPSDANYTLETTQRWDAFMPPSYVVSVKPTSETDIQKIIQYAKRNSIPFLGTGGGHGYSVTLGSIKNGIEVDLGAFNTVKINKAASTMTIGGSVRFGNVTGPLYAAGKEFQVGSLSCVGMVGASIGGGIGPYAGLHGLEVDGIKSVRMVTGRGDILDVSASSHSDLFWGIRGAGFNFGIITSATYNVYDFTNNGQLFNADFRIRASQNASVWEYLKQYEVTQPDNLAFELGIAYDQAYGGTYILVNVVYIGSMAEGMKLVQPLIDLKPVSQSLSEIPWKDLQTVSKFGVNAPACVKGIPHSVYSNNIYKIDVATFSSVTNYVNQVFNTVPGLQFSDLSFVQYARRVIESVPDDATAYPYRSTVIYTHFDVSFIDSNLTATATEVGQRTRALFQQTSGSKDLEIYVNLAHGDEGEAAWYGSRKLPRLHQLKKKYDPNSLFSNYNGLST